MINLRYANINAKLKGMHAKFLNQDELFKLSRQNDMRNAIFFLRENIEDLSNLDENSDRILVEKELDKIIIDDINKIEKVLSSSEKELFEDFVSKYEIKCLIEAYKIVYSNNDMNDSQKIVDLWTSKIFKEINGITKATNSEQFLNILKRTKYYKYVKEYIEKKDFKVNDLETILYKVYFENLYKNLKRIDKNLVDIIGRNIDLLNINWIFRMNKYYNISNENIKEKLINVYYKIDKKIIENLINSKDYDEFKKIVDKTEYLIIMNDKEVDLDNKIDKYLYQKCKKVFMFQKYNLNTVFSYMYLKEFEKQNIINILGGISYNIERKVIDKRIIT